jgi:hypothetical protein
MTIYIVTTGEYSDYRVDAVFDNEEAANNYIENNRDRSVNKQGELDDFDHYELLPWEMNSSCPLIKDRIMWNVHMRKDGETQSVSRAPNSSELECEFSDDWDWEKYRGMRPLPLLFARVEARDEQHAVKIVNERRIQLIAEDKWLNDEAALMAYRHEKWEKEKKDGAE